MMTMKELKVLIDNNEAMQMTVLIPILVDNILRLEVAVDQILKREASLDERRAQEGDCR